MLLIWNSYVYTYTVKLRLSENMVIVLRFALLSQTYCTDSVCVCDREAARECRRKKKEYVKCLENRVAVLENQNKTLIEELKSLKDLYCHKSE